MPKEDGHFYNILNDAAKFIEGRDYKHDAMAHLQKEVDAARRDGTWKTVVDKLKHENWVMDGLPHMDITKDGIDFDKGPFESTVDGDPHLRGVMIETPDGKPTKAIGTMYGANHRVDSATGDIIWK